MQATRTLRSADFADRLVKVLAVLLVAAIVAFAAYYTWDRRPAAGPAMVDRAITQAEQAVRDDPADTTLRLALGDLYQAKGRFAEAATQYEVVLQIDDTTWLAHRGLGQTHLSQSRFQEAGAEFRQVVDARKELEFAETDKYLSEAYYYLGRALIGTQEYEAAIQSLESALQIDRIDADAWEVLGAAYLGLGDPQKATAALKKAVSFVPKSASAYRSLAQAYRAAGDEVRARYAQAMVLYSDGDYLRAIPELEALTQAQPDLWDAWIGLGLVYEADLRNSAAADAYRRALAGNPGDFNAQTGLMRLGVPVP